MALEQPVMSVAFLAPSYSSRIGCSSPTVGRSAVQGQESTSWSPSSGTGLVALTASVATLTRMATTRRQKLRTRSKVLTRMAHGEDLSVAGDAFVTLGLAHCFEQGENGQLHDAYVLEPVSASTVEVVNNGAETSYEGFVGVTVEEVLAQDVAALPAEILCGHEPSEVRFADDLEFRTGCAARTWMRDHAREVVMKLVPPGVVQTEDLNTNIRYKRILNFVNVVKDSDNIKQDMSIDVYGRSDEDAEADQDANADIEALYNA